jgi:hypothetical protein
VITAPPAASVGPAADPWAHAFRLAATDRDPTQGDLVPFWIYPKADGAHIERHVLALPLSRDLDGLESLVRRLPSTDSRSARPARTISSPT